MDLNVETLDDLPSIEGVLNIPLSKFINFLSENFGYTGTTHYLMINWVNPTSLKAKSDTSKEDNTN